MSILFLYKVPRDYGFAPNPFWGFITLATCKPRIRKKASIGDFVLGLGGATTQIPGKILFVMKVEEIMTFNEYWNDERFQMKKPVTNGSSKVFMGDNIYYLEGKTWIQADSHHSLKNGNPNELNVKRDTKTDSVLISKDVWWYFGVNGIDLPKELEKYKSFGIGHTILDNNSIDMLINHLNKFSIERHRLGDPNEWDNQKSIGIERYDGK